MRRKRRMPVGVAILAGGAWAGLMLVAGCTLDKPESRPKQVYDRIGGHGGQVIEPRRCLLRVAILNRPFREAAINDVIWRVADEQAIAPEQRKALAANGLRIGRVIGQLPREIETILVEEGPHNPRVVPLNLLMESGEPNLISISPRVAQVSLLIDRDDRVSGRDYQDASGYLRVTPQHHGEHGVSLRIVPEIHHGPVTRTFPAMPNAAGLAPQELSIRDGQQEEAIRDLTTDIILEEGQVGVIGCRPENLRSLGSYLFSESPVENDERHQRLILIWASRNRNGIAGEAPKTSDRPKLFQRLLGTSSEPAPNPAPPDPTPPPIPATPPPSTPSARPAQAPARSAQAPARPQAGPPATGASAGAGPPPDAQSVPPLPGGDGSP